MVFLLGVAVSIALHEVGHMSPAKQFGVKVTQYFVGFGKTVWSVKRGETEYGVKAIPLGGFVKLVGMLPPDEAPTARAAQADTGLFAQLIADARHAEHEHVTDDGPGPALLPEAVVAEAHRHGRRADDQRADRGRPVHDRPHAGFGVDGAHRRTVKAVADCAISDAEAGRTCTDERPDHAGQQGRPAAGRPDRLVQRQPVDDWQT